jgi:arylsulfatase A-like enzyme
MVDVGDAHSDFGWADASWHRERGYKEVQSPHMQQLVDTGIELTRNCESWRCYTAQPSAEWYSQLMNSLPCVGPLPDVYKFCSPTRSAIQSGRNPIHVNAQNVGMNSWDPAHPYTGVSGIPVNMTGFAQRMAEAGYKHRIFAGKADFGMAYFKQSPMGRGYTDALFYFNHMNDYYSLNVGQCTDEAAGGRSVFNRDLYGTNPDGTAGPQYHMLNPQRCWVQNMTGAENPVAPFPKTMAGCRYEEDIFTNFTISHIQKHDPASDGPLLLFHAAHSIHTPLETVPDAFEEFAFIADSEARRAYHSMVFNVDRAIGAIVEMLKAKSMYDKSVVVLSADNGEGLSCAPADTQ